MYLNLAPGRLTVTEVLEVLVDAIPIEAAHVMGPDDGSEPSIYAGFRDLLPGIGLERLDRFGFYALSQTADTSLAIADGRPAAVREHPAHDRRGPARLIGRSAGAAALGR